MFKKFKFKINQIIDSVDDSAYMWGICDDSEMHQVDFGLAIASELGWHNHDTEFQDLINLMHQLANQYHVSYFQIVDIVARWLESLYLSDFPIDTHPDIASSFKQRAGA